MLYKTVKKIKKRNWRVKFWYQYNYTLQQTNAMLKILNVVINVSLKHAAVNLSTTTELNQRNSTVCERVINSQQPSLFMSMGINT